MATPSQPVMGRFGGLGDDLTTGLGLMQRRTALFCVVTLSFGLGSFVVDKLVNAVTAGAALGALAPSELGHLAGCVILLAGWLVARRRQPLPAKTLVILDGVTVVVACVAWAAMATYAQTPFPVHDAMLATAFTLFARGIIVPSSPTHTFVVALIASIPMPVASWLAAARATSAAPVPGVGDDPVVLTAQIVLWSLMSLSAATVTSKVIYGLRERVREARQLGQYTLERKIGAGGMGEVYKARHALLRRPTAIKLIGERSFGETHIQRFEQEVQLTSQLSHPNTIAIYDYGHTPDGVFYYAMEYLEGFDLERLVDEFGSQPPGRVIHIIRQLVSALAEAHEIGLIHRDVKPANVILCRRGGQPDVAKVLDFGLVKEITQGGDSSLTGAGVITGTPDYLAPETLEAADKADARSDLYAVGCTAYFLLTGGAVFHGSVVQVCSQHLQKEPAPPSERSRHRIGGDLESLVLQCLAKDPSDRPASARALEEALAGCQDADGWSRADAEAWWQEAEPLLGEKDPSLVPSTQGPSTTLQVDYAARTVAEPGKGSPS
jgi:serine/threonine protein kinase